MRHGRTTAARWAAVAAAVGLAGCGGGSSGHTATNGVVGSARPVAIAIPVNDNGVTLGLDIGGGHSANIVLGPDGSSEGPQGSASLLHGFCTGTSPNTVITVTSDGDSTPYDGWTAVFHQNNPNGFTVSYAPTAADLASLAEQGDGTASGKGQPGTRLTLTIQNVGAGGTPVLQWTPDPPAVALTLSGSYGNTYNNVLPAEWYSALGVAPIPTDSGDAYTIGLQFEATCAT